MKNMRVLLSVAIISTAANLHTMDMDQPKIEMLNAVAERQKIDWPVVFKVLDYISSMTGMRPNINKYKTPSMEDTLLYLAARDKSFLSAQKLLAEYRANPNIPGRNDVTPLMIACSNKDITMIKLLLSYGANPHLKNLEGDNSFNYARDEKISNLLTTYKSE
jgi:hypothetical protein